MFPERIETERLVLEQLCRQNVTTTELYNLFSANDGGERIFEHIPEEPYRTVKDADDRIRGAEERWKNREAAEYAVRPRDSEEGAGRLAGTANLSCKWDRRTGQLGILLGREFWGRGYSSERAEALLALGFDQLDLELVSAAYREGNENSKHAIEKYVETYGGQYDGVLRNWLPIDDEVADIHRYTITQKQYRKSTASSEQTVQFID